MIDLTIADDETTNDLNRTEMTMETNATTTTTPTEPATAPAKKVARKISSKPKAAPKPAKKVATKAQPEASNRIPLKKVCGPLKIDAKSARRILRSKAPASLRHELGGRWDFTEGQAKAATDVLKAHVLANQ